MTPSESQGQRRERGPEADEDDPTGIRDLLAALPDPGPMPEDLVRRIEARLAVEQAHREHDTTGGLAARSDSVVDLAAERSHRRPGRTVALLGTAAAGLLVATMALGEFAGIGPAGGPALDGAAQVTTRSGAGADGGAGAEQGSDAAGADQDDEESDAAGGDAGSQGRADEGLGPEAADDEAEAGGPDDGGTGFDDLAGGGAEILVLPRLGTVSQGDFGERIRRTATAGTQAGAAAEDGLTQAGARSCWDRAEPEEEWPTVHAAEAELEGNRVVVLLGTRSDDRAQAVVVPWACTEGAAVEPVTSVTWGD